MRMINSLLLIVVASKVTINFNIFGALMKNDVAYDLNSTIAITINKR